MGVGEQMTVGELRAALADLPQDALVVVRGVSGDLDEPYIDLASPPQPVTLAVTVSQAGPFAGQLWLEEPSPTNSGNPRFETVTAYDISGWKP